MTEDKQQVFSDEAIRRFLLGSLNSNEQSRFEQSLFVDESLEERVRLGELELSDDYTAGRLSRAERELFRLRFLLTAEREKKVAVSKALHDNFAFSPAIPQDSFWQQANSFFDIRRHAWKYAFAGLVLTLLLAGAALLVKKERSRLVDDSFRPPRTAPRPSATAMPQPAHHPPNSSVPTHTETSPTLPLHDGLTTSVLLASGTPLDSAPTISASGEVVRVQLILNEPLAESYAVSVTTVAGESVFSADALQRTEEKTLGFDVPAGSIKRGDFQVTLTRLDGDAKQSVETYYFRVR